MSVEVQDILVRKNIVVNAPKDHVFKTFTERIDTWWPRAHHIGGKEPFNAILEPRVGGRWFERAGDGSECNWGRVLAWDPTDRVLLSWDINAEWKYQADLGTEVEVSFVAESKERTRVVLEHRKLERYGDKAEMMRAMFESEGAWAGTLAEFAKEVERSAAK
jgi:Activator of Hsp90 ATPase homolog 1-like protein